VAKWQQQFRAFHTPPFLGGVALRIPVSRCRGSKNLRLGFRFLGREKSPHRPRPRRLERNPA
jgi:hypothetical protein